ncbi:MAG: metallophosphoesterase [Betaproteobacteria bacterium]
MKPASCCLVVLTSLCFATINTAQAERPSPEQRAERRAQREDKPNRPGRGQDVMVLPADVAELERLNVILGRPTDTTVTASIVSMEVREAFIEYGTAQSNYTRRTSTLNLPANQPIQVLLEGLLPGKPAYYRLRHRKPGETVFANGLEQSVQMQRLPGSHFVFEIQGDSHPERRNQFDPALYAQTLRAIAADRPDFYLLIGDDFSVDTLPVVNAETVTRRYQVQRPFLALTGQSAPLFLVNGNHEQAARANLDGTPDNVAVWAQNARNLYFPQPAPDGFYTGDATPQAHIGLLRDYYAWHWGDALFIVIDPYWHSEQAVDNVFGGGKKHRDLWNVTLGDAQYRWLKQTLETSRAKYKFVFTHHVHGTGRGGVELADLYEWGGKNRNGVDEFAQRRPGWAMPIHSLMVKNGVTLFFQGHDHIFARQELDGIVYQTLPEPADPNYALYNAEAYRSGEILPNTGRIRVSVMPEKLKVEYLRSYLARDASQEHPDGEVAFSYIVEPRTLLKNH